MLALILGQGRVPAHLTRSLIASGRSFQVLHLEGYAPDKDVAPDMARRVFRIEHLGGVIADLVAAGITDIAFVGAIQRPALDPSQIDAATMPLVPAMMAALQNGDDAALRTVIGFFEAAGIAVRAPEEFAPDLLPVAGVLTSDAPDARAKADVAQAAKIVEALGPLDVGQGAVVARGLAVAVEALPGTDAMLAHIAELRGRQSLPEGGVLWKAPKPGQDARIDRPTIGPDTVAAAARAGLSGIAVPAGQVLFPDRDAAIASAEAAGLFLWVREAD